MCWKNESFSQARNFIPFIFFSFLKEKAKRRDEKPFFFCSLFVNVHLDLALIIKPFCKKQKENGHKKRKELYGDLSFPMIYRHCSSLTPFPFYLILFYTSDYHA